MDDVDNRMVLENSSAWPLNNETVNEGLHNLRAIIMYARNISKEKALTRVQTVGHNYLAHQRTLLSMMTNALILVYRKNKTKYFDNNFLQKSCNKEEAKIWLLICYRK